MNSSTQSSSSAKARAARLASTWIEDEGKICFRRRIAGIAVLDTAWRGERRDLLQLEMLHVGRDHRDRGLGTRLFEQARALARSWGAAGLYISATPSENTVRFYQRRGAVLLSAPDADLFAREPDDVHLECAV